MHCNKFSRGRKNTQFFLLSFRSACTFCCDCFILNTAFRLVPRRIKLLKLKFLIFFTILILVSVHVLFISNLHIFKMYTTPTPLLVILHKPELQELRTNLSKTNVRVLKIPSEAEFKRKLVEKKLEKLFKYSERWKMDKFLREIDPPTKPTTRVHIFYYTSYENPDINGKWNLWNEPHMSSFNNSDNSVKTPLNIGSNYYPLLGGYSSIDPSVMSTHFKEIRDAGIGVIAALWNPEDNDIFSELLNCAKQFYLKVAVHLQILKGHNVVNILNSIRNITLKYTLHPSFFKIKKDGKELPVYYLFESYHTSADVWREILANDGALSIRHTPFDGVFIGLLRDSNYKYHIQKSNFDGFYTYFPSNGHTYGSTWKNWKTLQNFARTHKLLFFPSVSPGYIDTHGKPWNTALTRHRSRGHYYQVAWRSAIATNSVGVTITSFNDWQHGSQIEPAVPKVTSHFTYLDYEPEGPLFYLNLTRYLVKQFISQDNDNKKDITIY